MRDVVCLGCAHPAKFLPTVSAALAALAPPDHADGDGRRPLPTEHADGKDRRPLPTEHADEEGGRPWWLSDADARRRSVRALLALRRTDAPAVALYAADER